MGFSQRWETEVLFINAILMETNFKMLNTGVLSWDNQKLLNSLEYIKKWTNETNGGLEQEEEFTTKFLYDPSYKLIEESRILFYYSDIVNFFGIAPEKRKNLDFANGFSSLPEINKNELPIIYPNLVGNIPQESSLIFPAPLPLYWNELKTKVIKPWMYEQTEASPVDKPLHTVIEEWLKQRS
jgi:hypothetical protein